MRTIRLGTAIGLALAALSAPAGAMMSIDQVAKSAPDAAAKAAGLRLARYLYDEESQIESALKLLPNELAPAFRNDENFKALEAEYPGFVDALMVELRPAIERYTRGLVPEYQERIAHIYAAHLSAGEIEDVLRFFYTPTGRKIIRGMIESPSLGESLKEAMSEPDKPASYTALAKDHRDSLAATKKMMREEDEQTLIALTKKPYASRLVLIGPEVRKLDLEFSNRANPQFDNDMAIAFDRVIARYEAAKLSKK